MKGVAGGLLLIGALTLANGAGATHVTDKLAVGLHDAREDDTPRRVLISGTPVEMLERKDGFCRVRLGDGDSGWLECRYLTDEKPARAMLLESQARAGRLWEQVEGLKRQLEEEQRRVQELELRMRAAERIVGQQGVGSAEQQGEETVGGAATPQSEPPPDHVGTQRDLGRLLPLWLGAAGGFVLGALLFYWRCRRRFGGLRI